MNSRTLRPLSRVLALALVPVLSGRLPAQSSPANPPQEEIITLSQFDVRSERDYGYRATNSLTATRTGVEIAKTPLNISVLTEDLLRDIGAENLNEGLNLVTSVSTASLGNNGRIGGSGDGTRIRGFPISYVLRNGYRRDRGVSIRNVERIEVVKGPVSLLFGQTTPGGLMNYITKRPGFADRQSVAVTVGSEEQLGVGVDVERVLLGQGGKAEGLSVRVMASRDRRDFWRDYEFQDDDYAIAQVAWRPRKGINVLFEHEYLDRESNLAQGLPRNHRVYQADWARAVAEGRLFDANRWYGSIANWMSDIQARTGSRPPATTGFDSAAYPAGRFDSYNLGGPDARFNSRSNSSSIEADWSVNEQLSVRYGFNLYRVGYFEKFIFNDRPNADSTARMGETSSRNNDKVITTHQADLVFRHESRLVNSTLVGGVEVLNDYETDRRLGFNPSQGFVAQGISRPVPAPGRPDQGGTLNAINSYNPSVLAPVRLDLMITSLDVLASKVFVDQDRTGYYASYRGALLGERLQVSAGVRREEVDNSRRAASSGVVTTSNVADTTTSFGVTYEVAPGYVVFASRSESFIPTTGNTVTGGLVAPGEAKPLPQESGDGVELGLKVNRADNTLTGTLSLFSIARENISTRDLERSRADPRNADANSPDGVVFPFRVEFFKPAGRAEVNGVDAEVVWSPQRNFQLLVSGTHYLKAEFTDMTPLITTGLLPNATNPNATGATRVNTPVSIDGTRLPRTPDWSFSAWGKYTLTEGPLRGFAIGLGLQHRTDFVLFGAVSPTTGSDDPYSTYDFRDFRAPGYTLVDASLSYTLKVFGRPVDAALSVKNVTDKEYLGGTYTFGEPRRFSLVLRHEF
jgi:outer membrane receptor protein involved in Fe transport